MSDHVIIMASKKLFFLFLQKKVIQTLCSVSGVGGYSSEDGVDYWDKTKWDAELEQNEVFIVNFIKFKIF